MSNPYYRKESDVIISSQGFFFYEFTIMVLENCYFASKFCFSIEVSWFEFYLKLLRTSLNLDVHGLNVFFFLHSCVVLFVMEGCIDLTI